MPHPTVPSIANLRDKFSRPEKDRVPSELKNALSLLNLTSLTELEDRFLATTAFLIPWAVFRDSCLLVKNSRHETTLISRLDILWFYTQFDESLRRHDPCIEKPGTHFEIDKSNWGHEEHEKHLYAWLLQAFCVGKTYSPFGFQYFELRNICTAWVEVFVPIINAVRASYNVKGRRHYGRLALFIEDRCPSRLAFPEGNVSMPDGVINSPTPFRMVSKPTHLRGASQTVLTKKNYDQTERELRDVYPQYGGLVERPRFKQKMDDWLEVQRERAAHRKTMVRPEVVQYVPMYQPEVVLGSHHAPKTSPMKSPLKKKGSTSPIKQYADNIRRTFTTNFGGNQMGKTEPQSPLSPTSPKTPSSSKAPMIPYGKYSFVPRVMDEEPKSPLHGVTRQIEIPEDDENNAEDNASWPLPATPLPHPKLPEQRLSEQSCYTTIRHWSPYSHGESDSAVEESQRSSEEAGEPVWSPMGAPSAIPRPLKNGFDRSQAPGQQPLLEAKKAFSEARYPSYEGNGYQEEISLTDLHARQASAGSRSLSSDAFPSKPRSRLPAPIKVPPPYVGKRELRVASTDAYRNDTVPKPPADLQFPEDRHPAAWPSNNHPRGYHLEVAPEPTPPIPAKNPARRASSKRHLISEQLNVRGHIPGPQSLIRPSLREDGTEREMLRIVSRENIRAAVGGLTPESSIEDLRVPAQAPVRVASPPRLETYNSHMFPRKNAGRDGC